MAQNESLFPSIGSAAVLSETEPVNGETEDKATQEIESLCMECHQQGMTRLLLTSIPFFREVVVMSFRCEHCGATNNEVQSAGDIRPEGTVYTARILARCDLDRQIVRSPSCEIVIPEYELTLPPSQRGQLTTVEGLIRDVITDLSMDQPLRRIQDEDGFNKIEALLEKLKPIIGEDEEMNDQPISKASTRDVPMPAFTLRLDDPAGNSFIEFLGSMGDPKWNMRTYPRSLEQNVSLGLISADDAAANIAAGKELNEDEEIGGGDSGVNEEIFVFGGACSSCGHPLDTLMKKVDIPYFKDVLIMSTSCERCGYRDNEVKSSGAISEQGKRITLKVEDREDLSRDILKSDTAGLMVPEIDLVFSHGTLGGRFTTLEGILEQVYEELNEKVFTGDSAAGEDRVPFKAFLGKLKEVKNVERPFTLIIDDPLANSYVQNLYAPDPDPNMMVELYDRSWDQNEELGLNDIKVDDYEEEADEEKVETVDSLPEGLMSYIYGRFIRVP